MILLLKGKASQVLTDLIVFSFKWILSSFLWINPASFSPTLVSFPSHRGACIAFFSVFITENMHRGSGSIIQVQCPKAPWYPFKTIVQCVSKLTELDVFYHTHNSTTKWSLAFIHFVRHSTVRVIAWKALYSRSKPDDMLLIMHTESPCSFSSTDKILLE